MLPSGSVTQSGPLLRPGYGCQLILKWDVQITSVWCRSSTIAEKKSFDAHCTWLLLRMELTSLLLHILRVFSPRLLEPQAEEDKEIFKDFNDCGQLGDEDKKECIWGCDWKENPLFSLDNDDKFEVIFKLINDIGMVLQLIKK